MNIRSINWIVTIACMVAISGCSSLGLTLQTGAQLTKQTRALLECAPRSTYLPRELTKSVLPDHYLQPGDSILVEPVDFESDVRLPADQRVLADGTIDLGRFGRVRVAGLTLEQSEALIEEAIVESGVEATEINVRMLEPIHRYYVLGEVNSPGSYPLIGHETVLDGILAAGGLTSAAAPCKILLARPTPPPACRAVLPICYHQITQLGDTTTNYQLQPGDRIFIAARSPCEEICFWKASETCQFCNPCQRACPDPSVFGYQNPQQPIPVAQRLPKPAEDWRPAEDRRPDAGATDAGATDAGATDVPTQAPNAATPPGRLPGSGAEPLPVPAAAGGVSGSDRGQPRVPAAPATESDPPPEAPPTRLPKTIDGELDLEFPDSATSSQRFDPLWISPPRLGS